MITHLIIKGGLLGFCIAMPVGPIGFLCIRNSLIYGMVCGLLSGLGAATADALYGACAGFGVNALGVWFMSSALLRLLGALFLCYLGIKFFLAKGIHLAEASGEKSRSYFFLSTFLLTLTNPMTILSFAGIYAGLGVGTGSWKGTLLLSLGVFVGSALWWLLLSFSSSLFRKRMNATAFTWLNRLSGSIILAFGILSLLY